MKMLTIILVILVCLQSTLYSVKLVSCIRW